MKEEGILTARFLARSWIGSRGTGGLGNGVLVGSFFGNGIDFDDTMGKAIAFYHPHGRDGWI